MLPHSTHEIKTYPTTHDHTTPPPTYSPFATEISATTTATSPPWTNRQHDMIPILNWHFDMDLTLKTLCWLYWCRLPCSLAAASSLSPPPSLRIQLLLEIWGLMCVGGGGGGVCSSEVSRYPLDFCTNLRWLSARRECVTWVLSLNTF